ncbi:HET-domain-containing protein, partial [Lophium mytilinum]
WIQYCKDHHRFNCQESIGETLPRMRLIDCLACPPSLVHGREAQSYFALSYVWGNCVDTSIRCPFPRLPEILPRVVEDAIVVTRNMGGRYLWVDRYCIPDSKKIKHEQISKMDIIYAGAELTIFAVAGKDASYGLPGVGKTTRRPQPSISIGGKTYVSTLGEPTGQIRHSQFWDRAWCFQELMLSRRRLIFTDEQVYFQCNSMHCLE